MSSKKMYFWGKELLLEAFGSAVSPEGLGTVSGRWFSLPVASLSVRQQFHKTLMMCFIFNCFVI